MKIRPEIRDIIGKFSLKEPISVDSVLVNIDNDLYFITDDSGKKFVVREAKRVKEKDCQFEADLLQVLGDNSFGVSQLIPLKNGLLFAKTNENLSVFVFEFIEGKQYEVSDIKLHPKLAYLGGKTLGEMHTIASVHKKEIGENKKRNTFTEIDTFLKRDLVKISSISGFTKFCDELSEFKTKAIEWMKFNPDLCGTIHSDYGPQNVIFGKDNNCHVIDFDWACYGPFLKDVGQGIALWTQPNNETKWNNKISENFIKGYNDTAPKTIAFDSSLAFWACFACLSDACTFFISFLDGQYPNITLTNIEQCHGYKRFKYFLNELHKLK